MKSYKIIVYCFLVVFVLFSCKKQTENIEELVPAVYASQFGTIEGLKDGKNWKAGGFISKTDTLMGLIFGTENKLGETREDLFVGGLDGKLGKFKLNSFKFPDEKYPFVHFTLLGADGDLIVATYIDLVETSDNFVNVESYDATTKKMKGTITASLKVQLPKFDPNTKDVVTFKDLKFEVTFEK